MLLKGRKRGEHGDAGFVLGMEESRKEFWLVVIGKNGWEFGWFVS